MSLTIDRLGKRFGRKEIFKDFSYSFEDKKIYALVGESGVGKTTLTRIIAGLDTDHTGSVTGGDIGRVSVAFQEHRLIPTLTALHNVVLANHDDITDETKSEALSMLASLGISNNDANLFPAELSGGMKQRVSLARAFLKKAPILILDEPTGELDPENALLVRELIREQAKWRTVIIVTHSNEEINELSAIKIDL